MKIKISTQGWIWSLILILVHSSFQELHSLYHSVSHGCNLFLIFMTNARMYLSQFVVHLLPQTSSSYVQIKKCFYWDISYYLLPVFLSVWLIVMIFCHFSIFLFTYVSSFLNLYIKIRICNAAEIKIQYFIHPATAETRSGLRGAGSRQHGQAQPQPLHQVQGEASKKMISEFDH